MHVLVIDDEPMLARSVARIFKDGGFSAEHAISGAEMLAALDRQRYDVVVLDWTLRDADGIDLVRQVRARGDHIPVLVLTGRSEPEDVVQALDAGADDFVAKRDLEPSVLVARAAALARRARAPREPQRLSVGAFVIDESTRRVTVDGVEVHLAPTELRLLSRLAASAGRVVSRRELLGSIWGGADVSDNALDTSLKRLRHRLGRFGHAVRTVRERGITLIATAEHEAAFVTLDREPTPPGSAEGRRSR
jgi:DNA-binding response OmpR family regulator